MMRRQEQAPTGLRGELEGYPTAMTIKGRGRASETGAGVTLNFADLLRRHRRRAGLTQEELAERAGVSTRAITALERGVNRAPHRTTLELLSEALNLTEDESASFSAAARRHASESSSDTAEAVEHDNVAGQESGDA